MSDIATLHPSGCGGIRGTGVTLIELVIVVAIIAIILTVALPVYSNYVVRARIGEGLDHAQSAVSEVCAGMHGRDAKEKPLGPNGLAAGWAVHTYVETFITDGTCATPVITIRTRATGQVPDPMVVLTGRMMADDRRFVWRCASNNAPAWLLPSSCRG